jgi:hypothetical protein
MLSELRRAKLTVFIEVEKFDGSSVAALGVLWMDLVWDLNMN